MYIPHHFREERIPVIHQLIRSHHFATLVTMGPEGLLASHVPMLLDPEPAPFGTLRCHVARANPQWRSFSPDVPALAIFSGPQQYISPLWYETTAETGKVVPTWNYVVVHAYGTLQVIEDAAWLREMVTDLTNVLEAGFPEPWKVESAPADFISAQLKGIVGLEMPVSRLEGKWKVSQNRVEKDRLGVVSALEGTGDRDAASMAQLVRATLLKE
jgi:transcriptional regulator